MAPITWPSHVTLTRSNLDLTPRLFLTGFGRGSRHRMIRRHRIISHPLIRICRRSELACAPAGVVALFAVHPTPPPRASPRAPTMMKTLLSLGAAALLATAAVAQPKQPADPKCERFPQERTCMCAQTGGLTLLRPRGARTSCRCWARCSAPLVAAARPNVSNAAISRAQARSWMAARGASPPMPTRRPAPPRAASGSCSLARPATRTTTRCPRPGG
jgi:hypothetical protein